jgi:hypothetical protein
VLKIHRDCLPGLPVTRDQFLWRVHVALVLLRQSAVIHDHNCDLT